MRTLFKIYMMVLFSTTIIYAGDFLMPAEAFKPYAKVNEKSQIEAGIVLGDKIYLYKEKLKIDIAEGSGVSISEIRAPEAKSHHGDMVFYNAPKFVLNLTKKNDVNGMVDVVVNIAYQGCSDDGLCYEPSSKSFTLSVDSSKFSPLSQKLDALPMLNNNTLDTVTTQKEEKSQTDTIADTIKSGNIFIILLTFFGFGLLLAMTPCVFPMIPIISGLIISQGKGLTTKKAFALSITYVLAMAVAYTIAGVLAGLFGANLQAALQTPWVVYSFAFIFIALAFSMFGFYELKLPDAFVSKISSKNHGSGYIGVAVMGFLSALIVGPCVAAPLAGALVYIGQTGDALLGGMALFSMSLGMGMPLIVVGVTAGKLCQNQGIG